MTVASSYIRSLGCEEIPLSDALRALDYYPGEDPLEGDSSYIVIEGIKVYLPMRGFEFWCVVEPKMRDKWGRYEETEEYTNPAGINPRYAGGKCSRAVVRYRSFRPYVPFGILKDVAKTENAQLFLFMCQLQKEIEHQELAAIPDQPAEGESISLAHGNTVIRRKRGALIKELVSIWPLIEQDLSDASRKTSGLALAAKLGGTFWDVTKSIGWAVERGKITKQKAIQSVASNPDSVFASILKQLFKL